MTEILTLEKDRYILRQGDCLELLAAVPDDYVHCVITDPPYFIDGMGDSWDVPALEQKVKRAGVVGSLPVGMKFDKRQGLEFQSFMRRVGEECLRVLKPGGFMLSFSQARLYHRLGVALEDAGFEIRDAWAWGYSGQAKAFSQDHFVRKEVEKGLLGVAAGARVIESMGGRKTPQLRPMMEPIALAQKPKSGTFVQNWMQHEVGLINTSESLDDKFPGTYMHVPKPSKAERGQSNSHLTVKPLRLLEHLVRLCTKEGQIVLDPFAGSGTHGLAALSCGRRFIGFDNNREYLAIARNRLDSHGV